MILQLARKNFIKILSTIFLIGILIIVYHLLSDSNSNNVCFNTNVNTEKSSLELIYIVMRHGPRTPVDTYPNDPYVNSAFTPTGWGHITNAGKRELYELGILLNKRYGKYLGPYYTPDKVHAQSTASPRAMMTLATVLASMFPPQDTAMEWLKGFNWQPIPIYSEPLDNDTLLLVRTPCPRYFEAREEVLQLPEVKQEMLKYESLFRNLTELTGMKVDSAEHVNSLYITLEAEKALGLPLPQWTKEYFPHKMSYMAERSYIYNAYTDEMRKIKGGPFLKKMFDDMSHKSKQILKPHDRKLFIYTGHDWTVGNILMALNMWQRQMPKFSILAVFELHKDINTGDYYVEIFLHNDPKDCLKQLQIPNCDIKCPLDKFIALNQAVLPNDVYEERCAAKNKSFTEPPPKLIDQ